MSQTVIGIFDSASEAQEAVQQLYRNGFSDNNVDVSSRNTDESNSNVRDYDDNNDSFGSSISNFFSSLFGSNDDDRAKNYSEVAKRGSSVVTVHAQSPEEAHRASELLDEYGAVDVDERAQQYRSGSDTETNYNNSDSTTNSIPVIEEELQIDKREVETGGARLRSKIIERPVEESVRLRSERVNVERNPVDRPATEADFTSFKEGTIEVTERKEVPIVNKEARVVEEISFGKEVTEREETIHDTVRSTDVDVEKLDADTDLNEENLRSSGSSSSGSSTADNAGFGSTGSSDSVGSDNSLRRSDRNDDL